VFRFAQREKAELPVRTICRVLGVSPSGYYSFSRRPPSARRLEDERLKQLITQIHQRSRGTYGRPRVKAELHFDHDLDCSGKRVARLMRELGLQGAHRRRKFKTTMRSAEAAPAPDLVQRQFVADAPDRLWVADIKYVRTRQGFLHVAGITDLFSRRLVGWSMANSLHTQLVVDALEMALRRRRPQGGVVHHSDQGCQYTSLAFGRRLREAGVDASMGSRGDCFDNAAAESFWATLQTELLDQYIFLTRDAARAAIFDFIERWYNPHRRHSSLGQISPAEFERRWLSEHPAQATGAQ
jgi:transposase InsO family protein